MVQAEELKRILQNQIDNKLNNLSMFLEKYIKEEISQNSSQDKFKIFYQQVVSRIDELKSLIPEQLHPTIFEDLLSGKKVKYADGTYTPETRVELLFHLSKNLYALQKTTINLNESDTNEIRIIFENLFRKQNRKSIVHEIFNSLLEELKKCLDNNQIDKTDLAELISKIQSLLNPNQDLGFIDTIFNWKFAYNLIINIAKTQISGFPGLVEAIDALIKSFEEANIKILNIQKEVAKDASEVVKNDISLKHQQNLLIYNKKGLLAIA